MKKTKHAIPAKTSFSSILVAELQFAYFCSKETFSNLKGLAKKRLPVLILTNDDLFFITHNYQLLYVVFFTHDRLLEKKAVVSLFVNPQKHSARSSKHLTDDLASVLMMVRIC